VKRLFRLALSYYAIYLVSDLMLEMGGRASPAAAPVGPLASDICEVHVIDHQGEIVARLNVHRD